MEKILFYIFCVFVIGVVITLVSKCVKLINIKIDDIQTSTELKNYEQLNEYIDSAQNAIEKAVLTVKQTYVDSLKAVGNFTVEAQDEAKTKAIDIVTNLITEDCMDAIETVYDDFNTYLDVMIESIVQKSK